MKCETEEECSGKTWTGMSRAVTWESKACIEYKAQRPLNPCCSLWPEAFHSQTEIIGLFNVVSQESRRGKKYNMETKACVVLF